MAALTRTDDQDMALRVFAIQVAVEAEGPKAVAAEILTAAEQIYRFLVGADEGDRAVKH